MSDGLRGDGEVDEALVKAHPPPWVKRTRPSFTVEVADGWFWKTPCGCGRDRGMPVSLFSRWPMVFLGTRDELERYLIVDMGDCVASPKCGRCGVALRGVSVDCHYIRPVEVGQL